MRSDALVVEHVLKMREKNGLSNTGERSTNVASVLSIEDAREEEELSLAFPENKKDIPIYLLSIPWYRILALCIPNCQKEKWKNGIHCRLLCPSCSSDSSLTLWLNGAQELVAF